MDDRFGISEGLFDDYLLFRKKPRWWILKDSPYVSKNRQLKVWRVGLKVFQEVGRFVKPTTRMIQIFGHMADKAVLNIAEIELKKLVAGEPIPADMGIDNGYVILSLKDSLLGLGLLIDGFVRSQLPQKDTRFLTY
ncbi:hypothetical protein ACFL0H_01660 [Thermodesulfobacteriota bacterium]